MDSVIYLEDTLVRFSLNAEKGVKVNVNEVRESICISPISIMYNYAYYSGIMK